MNWIVSRVKEMSSWSGAALIGLGVCQHVGMGSCDMGNYIHSKKGLICLELDYSL